jgi:DNA-binding XRE family transcriptional regulator
MRKRRSLTLENKLDSRLAPDENVVELQHFIDVSRSKSRFDSINEFKQYLGEGALLNVSVLGSKALSVPCGEYLVWMTDAGHTMLVPTSSPKNREVFEHQRDQYEVLTRDLMANWNKLEKTISEDKSDSDETDETFESQIDASTVDRTPIMRAMEDRGYTVTALADEVGVDPPAISRILRIPKDVQGDPGGRNPSMGLASQICNVLRIDPTAAFPDIFNAKNYEARRSPGNRGSGSHSQGKGGGKWDKGSSTNESTGDSNSSKNSMLYNALCEEIATAGVPFKDFWNKAFIPSIRKIHPNTNLKEFINIVRESFNTISIGESRGFFGQRKNPNGLTGLGDTSKGLTGLGDTSKGLTGLGDTSKGLTGLGDTSKNQTQDDLQDGTEPYDRSMVEDNEIITELPPLEQTDPRVQRKIDQMNSQILPAIQRAFKNAMQGLKTRLQETQTNSGQAIAPHAWQVINDFYKQILIAGENYRPKWKPVPKGHRPNYASQFDAALRTRSGDSRTNRGRDSYSYDQEY